MSDPIYGYVNRVVELNSCMSDTDFEYFSKAPIAGTELRYKSMSSPYGLILDDIQSLWLFEIP